MKIFQEQFHLHTSCVDGKKKNSRQNESKETAKAEKHSMATRRDAVKAAFSSIKGQELSDDLINVALEICAEFSLSTDELATKWEAYIITNQLTDERPSRESLKAFVNDMKDKNLVKVNTNYKPPKTYTKETLPKYVLALSLLPPRN